MLATKQKSSFVLTPESERERRLLEAFAAAHPPRDAQRDGKGDALAFEGNEGAKEAARRDGTSIGDGQETGADPDDDLAR